MIHEICFGPDGGFGHSEAVSLEFRRNGPLLRGAIGFFDMGQNSHQSAGRHTLDTGGLP